MINYFYIFLALFYLNSCGYPDIDNVPDFKDLNLSSDEIVDYCSSINSEKTNIDKCINDYKSKI